MDIQLLLQPFVENYISCIELPFHLCQKPTGHIHVGLFLNSLFCPIVLICLFLNKYTASYLLELCEILKWDMWFLFSFSIFLSYSSSFLCPYKITLPITQKFYGIWLGISLNLYSHMGRIYIFTILNIPVPEHRNFLCLLRSSLIY